MQAAASLMPYKRLELQVCLDIPVGLTPPKATPAGPERAIVFAGNAGQGEPESLADGTQPGWLVLLSIRNQGLAPVRSEDFTDPLTFTFPGCQALAAWLCDAPRAEKERRPAARPTCVPIVGGAAQHPGCGDPGRVHLVGDFLLRPNDAYTIAVILSGTPTVGARPVRQDGTLATGRVVSSPCR